MTAGKISMDVLLVALIVITGALKLPSLLPGREFQLSAPGTVFYTACCAFPLLVLLRKVRRQTERVVVYAVQR